MSDDDDQAARIGRENSWVLAEQCRQLAARRRGHSRSRGDLALVGLATMLDNAEELPRSAEIGAMLELIQQEFEREA